MNRLDILLSIKAITATPEIAKVAACFLPKYIKMYKYGLRRKAATSKYTTKLKKKQLLKNKVIYSNLVEEKERVLSFELVTKFLPSVGLKSRNNLVLDIGHWRLEIGEPDTVYKADGPDNICYLSI